MVNIRDKVQELKKDILELDNLKKYKELEIKEWYSQCNHDFELKHSGYEEDIYICKKCGYEDWKRRSM